MILVLVRYWVSLTSPLPNGADWSPQAALIHKLMYRYEQAETHLFLGQQVASAPEDRLSNA